MPLVLKSLNLADAEKFLCETALHNAGSIVEASNLLGITRHALKRRIIKHEIAWPPRPRAVVASEPERSASPFPGSNPGGFLAD